MTVHDSDSVFNVGCTFSSSAQQSSATELQMIQCFFQLHSQDVLKVKKTQTDVNREYGEKNKFNVM